MLLFHAYELHFLEIPLLKFLRHERFGKDIYSSHQKARGLDGTDFPHNDKREDHRIDNPERIFHLGLCTLGRRKGAESHRHARPWRYQTRNPPGTARECSLP